MYLTGSHEKEGVTDHEMCCCLHIFFGLVSCQNHFVVIVDYLIEFLRDNYTRKGKEG